MNLFEPVINSLTELHWLFALILQLTIIGLVGALLVRFGISRHPNWAQRVLALCLLSMLGLPLLYLSGKPTVAVAVSRPTRLVESKHLEAANLDVTANSAAESSQLPPAEFWSCIDLPVLTIQYFMAHEADFDYTQISIGWTFHPKSARLTKSREGSKL